MSTDNKLKEIKLRLQLIMLLRKLNKIYAHDKAISSDEPKWITVHPHGKGAINKNGEDIKGTPVLIESETGEVLAGMGGKYNKRHISEACSKVKPLNTQHDIKRGQMMRENPQKFAAEQKAREQKAQQHLKDLQDTAKKETKKQLRNAKAKQTQAQKKQQATKLTQPNDPSKDVDYSLLDTDVKDITSGHEVQSWKVLNGYSIVKNTELSHDIDLAFNAVDRSGWKSAKGVVFDDKKLNDKFMHLEKEVFKYRALQRINNRDKHAALDAETVEKGEKLTQQYNEVCKQWAHSQLADVSQQLDKAYADYKNAYPKAVIVHTSKAITNIRRRKLCGDSDVQAVKQVIKFAEVCQGGKTLNDPDVKSLQCSDALKSFLIADSMSETLNKDMATQKDRIKKGQRGAEAQDRLNELKLYHSSIKEAADKAKSVLLAAHGVNTVEQAIIRETSKLAISQRSYIDTPAALVGVKRDKPMSFEKANNGAANPHFNSDITATLKDEVFKPYQVNCQTCVLTHEMRLRGYDVEAQPNYRDDSNGCLALSRDTLGLWRNKATGTLPDVTPLNSVFGLNDYVPFGARCFMQWAWGRGPTGHIVTVGHDQSGVYIYDPQTGKRHTPGEYNADRGYAMKDILVWRVDDCEFDDKVANSVLTKPNQPPIKK